MDTYGETYANVKSIVFDRKIVMITQAIWYYFAKHQQKYRISHPSKFKFNLNMFARETETFGGVENG